MSESLILSSPTNIDLIDKKDKCKDCKFKYIENDPINGVGKQKCMKHIIQNSDNQSCSLTSSQKQKYNHNDGDPPPLELKGDHNCNNEPVECHGCLFYDPTIYKQDILIKDLWDEKENKLNYNHLDTSGLESYLSNKDNLNIDPIYSENSNINSTCGPPIQPNTNVFDINNILQTTPSKMMIQIPNANDFNDFFKSNKIEKNKGIDWKKIKKNKAFEDFINEIKLNTSFALKNYGIQNIKYEHMDESIKINGVIIEFSNYGVDLGEWYNHTSFLNNNDLKKELPSDLKSISLDQIHLDTTGYLNKIIPYGLFNDKYDKKKMVKSQIYDWLLKRNMNIQLNKTKHNFKLLNIFTFDIIHDNDIEKCFNNLMNTNDNDKEFLEKINNLNDIYDLGDSKNIDILNYIERKINIFLSLNNNDIYNCLEKYYQNKDICNIGLSLNITKLLINFLNMESKGNKDFDEKIDLLTNRLSKYIPKIMKKNIDISEYYENKKCNQISNNTKMLKNLYDKLFNINYNINIPDWGLQNMIQNISKNWIGQIILLLVITYIFTQILQLFKFNYNINPSSQ